jgi:hypothetical protein
VVPPLSTPKGHLGPQKPALGISWGMQCGLVSNRGNCGYKCGQNYVSGLPPVSVGYPPSGSDPSSPHSRRRHRTHHRKLPRKHTSFVSNSSHGHARSPEHIVGNVHYASTMPVPAGSRWRPRGLVGAQAEADGAPVERERRRRRRRGRWPPDVGVSGPQVTPGERQVGGGPAPRRRAAPAWARQGRAAGDAPPRRGRVPRPRPLLNFLAEHGRPRRGRDRRWRHCGDARGGDGASQHPSSDGDSSGSSGSSDSGDGGPGACGSSRSGGRGGNGGGSSAAGRASWGPLLPLRHEHPGRACAPRGGPRHAAAGGAGPERAGHQRGSHGGPAPDDQGADGLAKGVGREGGGRPVCALYPEKCPGNTPRGLPARSAALY